ncbi:MAG: 1-acyl-sn-glycerol-3-phosphate acyltransferase [Sphingomonadales bacterium]|nr:1-acyl-sn-glycerol-3-phosphate acyltransferase [Sphingomonadales bacterium]
MALALSLPRSIALFGWLRIAIRLTAMLALLLACVPLYYLHRGLRLHNPWPRVFLGGVAWIAGVRVTYRGEKVHRGAFLLVNHVSWIDIPALAGATGTAFVGHDGLAAMPLLKTLCEMNDTVFVARHDRTSIASQVAAVRSALSETGALAIFPEGTTSDGTGLLPFKSSLISALEPIPEGIAVQPVVLDYGPEAAAIAWIGEEHGLDNFLRILARGRPVDLTVRFLDPLQGAALENRKTIAAAAREAILRALSA